MTRAIRLSKEEGAALLAKQAIHHALSRAGERKESASLEIKTGRSFSFTVPGEAEPAGSKKAFVPLHPKTKQPYRRPGGGVMVSVVDANPRAKDWKRLVAKIAEDECGSPQLTGALRVELTFYQPRPQAHYGATGLSKAGREKPFPSSKPDIDKLSRGVLDGMTGVIYVDDGQIVDKDAKKRYGEPARVEITVTEVMVDTGQESLLEAMLDQKETEAIAVECQREIHHSEDQESV